MKFILFLFLLMSCSPDKEVVQVVDGNNGTPGKDGSSCSTQQLENGAKIICEDGSFSYLFNGSNGDSGEDGSSCSVEANELGALISCDDGSSASLFNGSSGENGNDGQSCSLEEIPNGALISCGEESVAIYNGENGQDGEDAEPSVYPVVLQSYTSSNCTAISGSSYYVKANGSTSGVYSSSSCQSNTKVFELGQGDSIWLSNNLLAVKLLSTGIRTINFSL